MIFESQGIKKKVSNNRNWAGIWPTKLQRKNSCPKRFITCLRFVVQVGEKSTQYWSVHLSVYIFDPFKVLSVKKLTKWTYKQKSAVSLEVGQDSAQLEQWVQTSLWSIQYLSFCLRTEKEWKDLNSPVRIPVSRRIPTIGRKHLASKTASVLCPFSESGSNKLTSNRVQPLKGIPLKQWKLRG